MKKGERREKRNRNRRKKKKKKRKIKRNNYKKPSILDRKLKQRTRILELLPENKRTNFFSLTKRGITKNDHLTNRIKIIYIIKKQQLFLFSLKSNQTNPAIHRSRFLYIHLQKHNPNSAESNKPTNTRKKKNKKQKQKAN